MNTSLLKRYLVFAVGLFVVALGVALSTRCRLGTSPISSLPYVLSLGLPWTMGMITIIMHIAFILMQIILLRRQYEPIQLLQIVVAFVFGYFTDFGLYLVSGIAPATYLFQWGFILLSCVIVALGISLEVTANVLILPGEGLVKAFSTVLKIEFGKLKVGFDIALVTCAILSSFYLFGMLRGIREGTIAAAILVGSCVRLFNRWFKPLESRFLA
jgi:uncharacterized membrane protein YczE